MSRTNYCCHHQNLSFVWLVLALTAAMTTMVDGFSVPRNHHHHARSGFTQTLPPSSLNTGKSKIHQMDVFSSSLLLNFRLYSANPRQHEMPDSSLIQSSGINGDSSSSSSSNNSQQQVDGKRRNKKKILTASVALVAAAAAALCFSSSGRMGGIQVVGALSSLLPSPARMNEWLRRSLNKLNDSGLVGLGVYAGLFALWTMTVGITTPVETAAGFAFGAKRAVLVNALGKTLGALVAFGLGRFIFYDYVRAKASENEILQLVEESIGEYPLLVAIMVRLSPLPEPIKNMGMSVLDVKSRHYIASLLLHGFPFTCLWSCMGAETAKIVTLGVQPSTTLKVLVSGSTWFGVIISPTLIGWWLNSLRAKRSKRLALLQQQQQSQQVEGEGEQ